MTYRYKRPFPDIRTHEFTCRTTDCQGSVMLQDTGAGNDVGLALRGSCPACSTVYHGVEGTGNYILLHEGEIRAVHTYVEGPADATPEGCEPLSDFQKRAQRELIIDRGERRRRE